MKKSRKAPPPPPDEYYDSFEGRGQEMQDQEELDAAMPLPEKLARAPQLPTTDPRPSMLPDK